MRSLFEDQQLGANMHSRGKAGSSELLRGGSIVGGLNDEFTDGFGERSSDVSGFATPPRLQGARRCSSLGGEYGDPQQVERSSP